MDIESLGRKFVHDLQNRAYELVDDLITVLDEAVDAAVDVAKNVEDKITPVYNVTVNTTGPVDVEDVLKRASDFFFSDRSDEDIEANEEPESDSYQEYMNREYNNAWDAIKQQAQAAPAQPGGTDENLDSILNSIYNYLVEEGYYSQYITYSQYAGAPLFIAEDFKTYLTDKARRGV